LVRRRQADGCLAAADQLREVCAERFGSVAGGRRRARVRYDGSSCFRSDHYQAEIDHLTIARSAAFHYEPETNGCAEKAIQVLKEQVLWIEPIRDTRRTPRRRRCLRPNLQPAVVIERHDYRTPIEAREHLRAEAAILSRAQRRAPGAVLPPALSRSVRSSDQVYLQAPAPTGSL
jgi:putative transposase